MICIAIRVNSIWVSFIFSSDERKRKMALMTCQREYSFLCWSCHIDRLNEFDGQLPVELLRKSSVSRNLESACRKEAFKQVLKQIAIHKAFRQQVYAIYKYVNTACYFKSREGGGLNPSEASKIAKPINRDSITYDNLHKIIWNLQNCPTIDITSFSANMLYKALDPKWCHVYEEVMRERGNRPGIEQYEEDEFQDFLQMVRNHPVFTAIDKSAENNYGKRDVTALMLRAQKELLQRPKRRHPDPAQ